MSNLSTILVKIRKIRTKTKKKGKRGVQGVRTFPTHPSWEIQLQIMALCPFHVGISVDKQTIGSI